MAEHTLKLPIWAQRTLSVLLTVLGLVVVCLATIISCSFVPAFLDFTQPTPNGFPSLSGLGVLAMLSGWICSFAIFARHRQPWIVLGVGAFSVVVLQLDPVLMLIGMAAIIARRSKKEWLIAAVAAGALTLWVLLRNLLIFDTSLFTGMKGAELVAVNVFLTIVLYGGAFMIGWLRRNKASLDAADARADEAQQQAEGLAYRVNQQAERERLAREIHDALAHRLSLVSLHSGALEEAARRGDATTADAAQVIRNNAHRSLEDLRDLIGALRNPSQESRPVEEPTRIPLYGMADVAEVIDSTVAAGVVVNAFVMLCDPDDASELLNRAVFRIVQESLTNVVKHAPGSTVGIDLRAAPKDGVSLRIRNQITRPGGYSMAPGSGSGLVGMRERVNALDGRITVGPTGDGWFEVRVQLPWRSAK